MWAIKGVTNHVRLTGDHATVTYALPDENFGKEYKMVNEPKVEHFDAWPADTYLLHCLTVKLMSCPADAAVKRVVVKNHLIMASAL